MNKIPKEEIDLWFTIEDILSQIDFDWMYSDRTEAEQEASRRLEVKLSETIKELEERGWKPTPYVEIKTKALRGQCLTPDELDLLVFNPLSGHTEGWRKEK